MARVRRSLVVLGATGSIGRQTLDVVRLHPDDLSVQAVSAHRDVAGLARVCAEFSPALAVIADAALEGEARAALVAAGAATRLLAGPAGLVEAVTLDDADTVVAGIVGAAGLPPTLAAAAAGKRILLANKEALVVAGDLFLRTARGAGAEILPVDSEHNALFQCLPAGFDGAEAAGVEALVLTASGGPFRTWNSEQMAAASPQAACRHPKWSMGRKISVDSATLMNKGLEVIEASLLFGLPGQRIEVVIHPESIVHGMVRYRDGSVLAQLSEPDMRTPLASALFHPGRGRAGVRPLDLTRLGALHFEPPDPVRFPCLELAYRALERGGASAAWLNAANEVAVQAFLEERIPFDAIARINGAVLDAAPAEVPADLDAVLTADRNGRHLAESMLAAHVSPI